MGNVILGHNGKAHYENRAAPTIILFNLIINIKNV